MLAEFHDMKAQPMVTASAHFHSCDYYFFRQDLLKVVVFYFEMILTLFYLLDASKKVAFLQVTLIHQFAWFLQYLCHHKVALTLIHQSPIFDRILVQL